MTSSLLLSSTPNYYLKMQYIILAAGLTLVNAAALPQLATSDELMPSEMELNPNNVDPMFGEGENPFIEGSNSPTGDLNFDSNTNFNDMEGFNSNQLASVPADGFEQSISGSVDPAEVAQCEADLLVDYPNVSE